MRKTNSQSEAGEFCGQPIGKQRNCGHPKSREFKSSHLLWISELKTLEWWPYRD